MPPTLKGSTTTAAAATTMLTWVRVGLAIFIIGFEQFVKSDWVLVVVMIHEVRVRHSPECRAREGLRASGWGSNLVEARRAPSPRLGPWSLGPCRPVVSRGVALVAGGGGVGRRAEGFRRGGFQVVAFPRISPSSARRRRRRRT